MYVERGTAQAGLGCSVHMVQLQEAQVHHYVSLHHRLALSLIGKVGHRYCPIVVHCNPRGQHAFSSN